MGDEFGLEDEGRLFPFDLGEAYSDPAPEPDDDDDEAWLRSMPPDLRAEVLARSPLPPRRPGASPLEALGGVAAFADGGFCDTMLPGPVLGEMLTEAAGDGYQRLSDDVLTGMLRAWQRQVSNCQSELAWLVAEIASRRTEQAARPGWSRVAEHIADEVGVELTLTGRSAARLLDVARGLQRLPAVNDALLSGMID